MDLCRSCFYAPAGTGCLNSAETQTRRFPPGVWQVVFWTGIGSVTASWLKLMSMTGLDHADAVWRVYWLHLCVLYVFISDVSFSINKILSSVFFFQTGDAKSEDTTNKEAGEEKPEEDNDYHRSDEQVILCFNDAQRLFRTVYRNSFGGWLNQKWLMEKTEGTEHFGRWSRW